MTVYFRKARLILLANQINRSRALKSPTLGDFCLGREVCTFFAHKGSPCSLLGLKGGWRFLCKLMRDLLALCWDKRRAIGGRRCSVSEWKEVCAHYWHERISIGQFTRISHSPFSVGIHARCVDISALFVGHLVFFIHFEDLYSNI
ncbi:hypothetical protein KSP40_PGU003074 [Platanthera guangdongensis]|uniref:Uncharacterized protein n=1 Tax=Platanthera guangdongensis TaxID=2320717 RepID=A0ABR2LVT4_9ASPA